MPSHSICLVSLVLWILLEFDVDNSNKIEFGFANELVNFGTQIWKTSLSYLLNHHWERAKIVEWIWRERTYQVFFFSNWLDMDNEWLYCSVCVFFIWKLNLVLFWLNNAYSIDAIFSYNIIFFFFFILQYVSIYNICVVVCDFVYNFMDQIDKLHSFSVNVVFFCLLFFR